MEEILNNEIYQKYPRLYAISYELSLGLNDLEEMLQKIKENEWCKKLYNSESTYELGLKVILIRFNEFYPNLNFKTTLENIKPLQNNYNGIEKLQRLSGTRYLPILVALLN